MELFLIYLGKVALAMCAFFLVFLLLFQKQKHFGFNRIYLLASMAISYLIPLITFTIVKQVEAAPVLPEISYNYINSVPYSINEEPASAYYWYHYLFALLMVGVSGFLIHFVTGNLKALNIVRKSYHKKELGAEVCITKEDVHPFSFFNKVIISEKNLNHPNLSMILDHEKLHVNKKHTIDILIAELFFLLEWFNPFAWLLKDAVKNNLEFLTDSFIIQQNDRQTYQLAMVSLADKKGVAPFLTALNGSQLKSRIMMMKKKTENKFTVVKQLFILPLLAILIMGLSNKEVKTELIKSEQIAAISNENKSISVIVDGITIPTNGEQLKSIDFSKEVNGQEITDALGINPDKLKSSMILFDNTDELKFVIVTDEYVEGSNPEFDKLIYNKKNEIKKSSATKTLYAVDGKIISEEEAKNLDQMDLESVVILSGSHAVKKYGEVANEASVMDFTSGEPKLKVYSNTSLKESSVTGKVSDKNGIAISGASVIIKGKPTGTLTDNSGNFVLNVTDENSTLIFNAIGYKKEEVTITDKTEINVQLKELSIEERFFQGLPAKENNEQDFPVQIKGKVKDENGNAILGASVIIKNKTIGTVTEASGNFVINVPDENAELIFNAPGYEKKEIVVGDQKEIDVILKKKNIKIIGYPKPDSLSKTDTKIKIKGFGSLNGNEPLYIVDEKPTDDISNIEIDSIASITVYKDEPAIELYGEKAKDGIIIIETRAYKNSTLKTNNSDEAPKFPGGENALRNFINKSIKYPEIAKEKGIQGKVFVTFTIDKKGKVKQPHIIKGVDPSLDKEALRVVNTLPDWEPAKKDGKAAEVSYTVPVNFNTEKPLIVIDGEVSDNSLDNIESDINKIENINVIKGEAATDKYGEKAENGVIEINTADFIEQKQKELQRKKENSEVLTREELFFMGGAKPEFPGGETALRELINSSIEYPEIARQNGIQGKVFVTFTIDKKGKVKNPKISKGVDPSLNKEAIRVILSLPEWEPAKQNGKAVEVLYTVPVNFKL